MNDSETDSVDALLDSVGVNQIEIMDEVDVSPSTQAEATPFNPSANWPESSLYLASGLLLFCLAIFVMISYLITRNYSAEKIVRTFALPLIIISALFLVVVGYSQDQIAPVMALLSAIAGYLLGSDASNRHENNTGVKNEEVFEKSKSLATKKE